jgi:hypothetical protein
MAILDYQLQFSDAQPVTTTAASTNVIDTGIADSNLGGAGNAWVCVTVNTAFTGATNMTVTLQDSADDDTYATLLASEVYLEAALVKGEKLLWVPLPAEHARYLRIYYTVTGAHNAGKADAYITLAPQTK